MLYHNYAALVRKVGNFISNKIPGTFSWTIASLGLGGIQCATLPYRDH